MTVKELIALLSTLPQDAPVALPHYWDHDVRQLDVINANSISVETGKARPGESVFDRADGDGGMPIVVIS